MALNQRERTLLIAVLSVAAILGNWVLVGPLINAWTKRNTDIHDQRLVLERVRRTVEEDAPQWREQYAALQSKLGDRASVFSNTSDVLKKVDDVGTECGLTVPVKKTLPVMERDAYRELPVQCKLEGSLEGLVKFLYTMQTASGMVTVDQIQIYPPRAGEGSQLSCDLVVIALASKTGGTAP